MTDGLAGHGVALIDAAGACGDLLDRFVAVSDGRSQQAREHPVAAVLALAAAAVVAGMQSFTAIAGWVRDVAPEVVHRLYARCGMAPAVPSRSTLWRVLTGADGASASVDFAIGAWLAARLTATDHAEAGEGIDAVMVDGKTLRGALDTGGHQVHLLAAATHTDALVLAQTEVGAKTNEIPTFASLLDGLDIAGLTVTADALHTQRSHATYLRRRGADFVFMVKDNQPKLFAALDRLDWPAVPIGHASDDRGHGRVENRTIQIMPTPDGLPFPHVNQVFLVERCVTNLHGTSLLSDVAIFGVTSLDTDRAGPADLARLVRGHWGIESLHWTRDTLYREDHSTARTRSGPRVMAALRNLAIGALRLFGRHDLAEATRWANRDMTRPFTVLDLST